MVDFDRQDKDKEEGVPLADSLFGDFADMLDPNSDSEGIESGSVTWKPQAGPQKDAFYSEADELFFGGAAGGGKMLGNDVQVITPFGYKKHGDLEQGDQVCNPDGSVARVAAVFENGVRDMYRVTFTDGASVVAGDEHLWLYSLASKRVKRTSKYYDASEGWQEYEERKNFVGTTLQLKEHVDRAQARLAKGKRPYHPLIPLTEPVSYTVPLSHSMRNFWIDPYFLGLLIGRGSVLDNCIQLTTVDEEIRDWAIKHWGYDRCRWDGVKHLYFNDNNEFKTKLKYWNLLNKRSWEKFLPERYLLGTIEQRFNLMQGLIDTDGTLDSRGRMSYTSVSKQLAKDVQRLAHSLGAKATITSKQGRYRADDGTYAECREAYTVYMQGRHLERFVRLPRKKERHRSYNRGKSIPKRRVESVEYAGRDRCKCIAVNHPNQLYLVEDFIVTHNTDLTVGLSTSPESPHKDIIVYRNNYSQLKGFVKRTKEVLEGTGYRQRGGNSQIEATEFLDIPTGKHIELGGVENMKEAEKFQGRPHDLIIFDEMPTISEDVYTFLISWNRTARPGVPTRIVGTGNPPKNTDEQWVIRRWRAWLDDDYPNPANPGEIRWFANLDGEDTEITEDISPEGAKGEAFEFQTKQGRVERIIPRSRTFIPARLADNKYLGDAYLAQLQSTPEPLRSALLYGDFKMTQTRDHWQVIPVEWIKRSQRRWREMKESGELEKMKNSQACYGMDIAEEGSDKSALVKIANNVVLWVEYSNSSDVSVTRKHFSDLMGHVKHLPVAVDAIGAGKTVADEMMSQGYKVYHIKASRKATKKVSGYEFTNLRSQLYFEVREALNPDNDKYDLVIPDSKALLDELSAANYDVTGREKVFVESKLDIRKKLGRSPDGADALMYAYYISKYFNNRLILI